MCWLRGAQLGVLGIGDSSGYGMGRDGMVGLGNVGFGGIKGEGDENCEERCGDCR